MNDEDINERKTDVENRQVAVEKEHLIIHTHKQKKI